ncbi:hypothetical protein HS088_TW21G00781 [Tripterygium wilfordii]|uniref:Uncharacterized protein n=1 Tax=Tripterygium wilfordii TaxID=458696 RepID=A0A7J7C3C7_TRIWF|nr:hypothetical protein HS088_TW21G00781 [Tripterygium wilfordii]
MKLAHLIRADFPGLTSLLMDASYKLYGFEDELISIGRLLRKKRNNDSIKAVGVMDNLQRAFSGRATLCSLPATEGEKNSLLTHEEKWDAHLGYGLPKGTGGEVIVTSRKEGLVMMMVGEENLHQLQPYSDPESCWSIFIDTVRRDGVVFNPKWKI